MTEGCSRQSSSTRRESAAMRTSFRQNWVGSRTADRCVGLIKGYGWLDAETLELRYGHERYADSQSGTTDTL